MKRFTLTPLVLAALASTPLAALAQIVSIKGADVSNPGFAVYLDASYRKPQPGASELSLVNAQLTVLTPPSAVSATPFTRKTLQCRAADAPDPSAPEQRNAQGLSGAVLWLDCQPKLDSVGLLNPLIVAREAVQQGIEMAANCQPRAALGTAKLGMFVIGHQEICLEDWSRVRDPAQRLVSEYIKRNRRD
jgi:hypothetical protein